MPNCEGSALKGDSHQSHTVTCVGCVRVISREELRRENEENAWGSV